MALLTAGTLTTRLVPPRRAERTQSSPTTSQRSVCQRSGPLERALAREVTPSPFGTAGCTTSP